MHKFVIVRRMLCKCGLFGGNAEAMALHQPYHGQPNYGQYAPGGPGGGIPPHAPGGIYYGQRPFSPFYCLTLPFFPAFLSASLVKSYEMMVKQWPWDFPRLVRYHGLFYAYGIMHCPLMALRNSGQVSPFDSLIAGAAIGAIGYNSGGARIPLIKFEDQERIFKQYPKLKKAQLAAAVWGALGFITTLLLGGTIQRGH